MKTTSLLLSIALSLSAGQALADTYVRFIDEAEDTNEAVLTVTKDSSGNFRIDGFASWAPIGDTSLDRARVGSVSGALLMKGGIGFYQSSACHLNIKFDNETIIVANDNHQCGGLNVTFDGVYRKQPE